MYVPTNHIYVGDIFLLGKEDIIRTNLSVREGLGDLLLCHLAYKEFVCKIMLVLHNVRLALEPHARDQQVHSCF